MLEKRNLLVQEALSAGLAVSGLGKSTHLTMPHPYCSGFGLFSLHTFLEDARKGRRGQGAVPLL